MSNSLVQSSQNFNQQNKAILQLCEQYYASSHGIVPRQARPEILQKNSRTDFTATKFRWQEVANSKCNI
ncbi:MAG: hypothetical protein ACREPR_12740 [Brasilonema sp.]